MAKAKKQSKGVRKNFRLAPDLADWVERYASNNKTTMTRIITDYFIQLRRETENGHADQI